MKKSLDALIIFPPPYTPTELQPGIAAVAGFAKDSGLKVEVIDANIRGLEFTLRKEDEKSQEDRLSNFNTILSILRNSQSYTPNNFDKFRQAKDAIANLSVLAAKRSGEVFSLHRNTVEYIPSHKAQSREGILSSLIDQKSSIFNRYFEQELLPDLQRKYIETGYKAIGIGITDRKQALPGFFLANMIKEHLPDVKVIIGGNFISRAFEAFIKDDDLNRKLFKHFDYMVYLEADKPFAELVTSIRDKKEMELRQGIEKLIWKQEGKIHHTKINEVTDISTLPLPEFDGLEAWTPEPAISYNFQRGCLYGKCGFCGLMSGYDSYSMRSEKQPDIFVPRKKRIDAVVEDIKELVKRGYKYINFTDETFFAADMERFSKKIIEEEIPIKWTSYSRVENKFNDPKFCQLIAKAGCEFIQFGVESASIKSLQLMDKGVDNANVHAILQNTHNAGIMNHVFAMVGYPGETIEDALTLFPFLDQAKDYTFTVKPTWFKLSRGSPDSYRPDVKGLKRSYTEGDLAPNLHFEKTSGMSKKASQAVNELLNSWVRRYHQLNYVSGTYCYSQRFFVGYTGIMDIANKIQKGEISRDPNFTPNFPYTKHEQQALGIVWGELVGEGYLRAHQKFKAGNRNPKFLEAYEKLRENNLVTRHFPNGFSKVEEVVEMAYNLSMNE